MSGLSLPDLLGAQAGPWQAAADGWRRLAKSLDDVDEQLISDTRDLAQAWPSGTGGQAAAEKARTLRARVSSAYGPARSIGDQLEAHAYGLASLRQLAEQIIASARQAGYTVDTTTGAVAAQPSALLGAHTGRETAALADELRSVVERARALDDATANILGRNAPSAAGGSAAGQASTAARATDLALKIKDPRYQPTAAELDEFRDLVTAYGNDKVFAFDLLNALGPKGLLELNGTLATYQLDRPGKDVDSLMFNGDTAGMVRDLQNGLGVMLDTATEASGTTTGLRGETYIPGDHELSSQWVGELMAAGRSKMDIGDPHNPLRSIQDVYGYQLLGPLLHDGDYDPRFVATVGGDMIDFEMEQGKNSALWTETRGENIRLDWTRDHNVNTAPAGYDPVNALMDGLAQNGGAARDLLTGVATHSGDGPESGRLPRLSYLLTDRTWNPIADVPSGPGWTVEVAQHRDDYKNSALDTFGHALERATTDHPGPEARRLVEAIIFETSDDEQAKGYKNGEVPDDTKTKTVNFSQTDLIHPELRDSMANIVSAHIADLNQNVDGASRKDIDYGIQVNSENLTRFLADVGKDQGAHDTVVNAETRYAVAEYGKILRGEEDPNDDFNANLRSMEVVARQYGGVVGALDYGAGEVHHVTAAQQAEKHNENIEKHFRIFGPLVEGLVGAGTRTVPGGADVVNGYLGDFADDWEESLKIDNQARATYEVGTMLGASRSTTVDLTEAALYSSGKLPELPSTFYSGDQLKPANEWTGPDHDKWQRYKEVEGRDAVSNAAVRAGDSYQSGLNWAKNTMDKWKNGES